MYVARDQQGQLHLFDRKPERVKEPECGYWRDPKGGRILDIDNRLFPEVKWTDTKPTRLTINKA